MNKFHENDDPRLIKEDKIEKSMKISFWIIAILLGISLTIAIAFYKKNQAVWITFTVLSVFLLLSLIVTGIYGYGNAVTAILIAVGTIIMGFVIGIIIQSRITPTPSPPSVTTLSPF